jgi:hypothetical protein
MSELLQSYNKINKIMKLHGHSNEYKQCYKQLNENEKYVIKKLKIIKNNNQQNERKAMQRRIDKELQQYLTSETTTNSCSFVHDHVMNETSEEEQMEKDKATEIRNKMETIIKELNNNIINK